MANDGADFTVPSASSATAAADEAADAAAQSLSPSLRTDGPAGWRARLMRWSRDAAERRRD